MKKAKKKLCLLALCMTMTIPMNVQAQETSTQNSARSTVPEIVSVEDKDENVYGLMLSSYKSGKKAIVSTYWDVSYVHDGLESTEDEIREYTKTVKSYGQVSMAGGATNNFGNYNKTFVDVLSGTHTTSGSYLYTVTSVVGTHSFSCNGGSRTYTTLD